MGTPSSSGGHAIAGRAGLGAETQCCAATSLPVLSWSLEFPRAFSFFLVFTSTTITIPQQIPAPHPRGKLWDKHKWLFIWKIYKSSPLPLLPFPFTEFLLKGKFLSKACFKTQTHTPNDPNVQTTKWVFLILWFKTYTLKISLFSFLFHLPATTTPSK